MTISGLNQPPIFYSDVYQLDRFSSIREVYIYTEGIVSAQQDLNRKVSTSIQFVAISTNTCCHESSVPNRFDLIVWLHLHQEQDYSVLVDPVQRGL